MKNYLWAINRNVLDSKRRLGLSSDEGLPLLVGLGDDLISESLVFVLAIEGEVVLGLAIWDLVGSEPLSGVGEIAWFEFFDVLEVVDLVSELVFDVDAHDLPVSLSFVDHGEDSESFDLDDLTTSRNSWTDFAKIDGIVITAYDDENLDLLELWLPSLVFLSTCLGFSQVWGMQP